MGKVIVFESISIDGVMQAPGRPDEDTRDGFDRGGWAAPYGDEVMGRVAAESMANAGPLLFGRRTYEDFYGFWPKQSGPFVEVLNNAPKYVVSTTMREPLPWQNSTLISGDLATAVEKIAADSEQDIVVLGSGELVRTLREQDLVDRYILQIHPLVLGTGRRLFPEGAPANLRLADSVTTTTGVVIAHYDVVR